MGFGVRLCWWALFVDSGGGLWLWTLLLGLGGELWWWTLGVGLRSNLCWTFVVDFGGEFRDVLFCFLRILVLEFGGDFC